MIAYHGTCCGGQQRGGGQQGHLGGGVEAHPEDDPDRVHLPFLVDGLHPAAEEAVEEAAVLQLPLQLGLVVLAAPHRPEDLDDPGQDDQVEQADEEQEGGGDDRAEQAAELLQAGAVVGHRGEDRLLGDDDADPDRDDDGGVAEGEEEPERNGRGWPVPCRSFITLRVVLSIAEMWSASKAWRRPRV